MNDESASIRTVFLEDGTLTNVRGEFDRNRDEGSSILTKAIVDDIRRAGPISRELERTYGLRRRVCF